jgi:hypothetical protein
VIYGSGNPTTIAPQLPAFKSVNLMAVGNVRLTAGPEQAVSITIDDNIAPYLSTIVTGQELQISTEPGVNLQDYDLTVDLTMTDVERLSLTGVGSISGQSIFTADRISLSLSGVGNISLDIEVEELVTTVLGVGNVSLAGYARSHDCVHSGLGLLDAFAMVSDTATLIMSGAGDAKVYVDSLLNVTITGVGSVYYKGDPEINVTITGLGQLLNAN